MAERDEYSPRNRAERVISAARLLLAVLLALAVVADVTEPEEFAPVVRTLAFSYLAYAVGIAILTWTRRTTTKGVPFATQVTDLVLFSAFMYLTDGARSPFFPYFVFSTIAGTIRWHGRGALLTGAAALIAYVAATLMGAASHVADDFNTAEFVARSTQLALVTGLLAYLGVYQHRLQGELRALAAWPRHLPTQADDALREILSCAATVLAAPRVVLVWEEGDEPVLSLAWRTATDFDVSRHRPDVFGVIVPEAIERSSFVCTGLGTKRRTVLQRVPGGFRLWDGEPLSQEFRERFDVRDVIALRLASDSIQGWLFALDRRRGTPDDILLGDIVGRLIAGALELQSRVQQLRETAAGEERVHLARELHDGVLQSLTAASLQAQRARQSMLTSPADAERRLAMIEETILSEQQALRLAIEDLKPGAIRETTPVDIGPRVSETTTRLARQWDVRIHLNLQRGIPPIPQKIGHEFTRMLQEAVVNAIRHGGAREITVTCLMMSGDLALAVSYQGRGFAGFYGRHDLESLNRMKVGPRTLKERVSAVSGSLVIESGEAGARVEVRIPQAAVL